MEHGYWHARWRDGRTPFHREAVNPALAQYAAVLPPPPARVLVPLCGKSVDLTWLARKGYGVLGVELSPIAALAFFQEQALEFERASEGPFEVFRAKDLDLEFLCGDVFDLNATHLRGVTTVYDRAALVALPAELRARYVALLAEHLTPGTRCLLISIERTIDVDAGPPFSLAPDALRDLFAGTFELEPLDRAENLEADPRGRIEVPHALRRA